MKKAILGMNMNIMNEKELKEELARNRKETVEKFPEKKWMRDPFVGFIERK